MQLLVYEAALNAVGKVMGAALKESAEARSYARLATSYAIDITSYMTEKKVLDGPAKEQKMQAHHIPLLLTCSTKYALS